MKLRGIVGPDASDTKEITVLNRVIRWTSKGLEYEPDPRHAELLIEQLALHGCKSLSTPGVKDGEESLSEPLSPSDASLYRSMTARANYLAQDRPDVCFAVKELARHMSSPSQRDWERLKHLGRYLRGRPRLVQLFAWQRTAEIVTANADSDWAGCKETRRSTSGGTLKLGSHLVRHWSSTQATIALSSGEAEYAALVKAAGIMLGFRNMLRDAGADASLSLECDSSAAIGVASRNGLGKLRHLDVHLLWLQQHIRNRTVTLIKVEGPKNVADVLTKHVKREVLDEHVRALRLRDLEGRAESAPSLCSSISLQN